MDQNAVWAALSAGVPEDVERLYQAGRFAAADRRIQTLLGQEHLPAIARDALRARAEQMRRLPESYPHTRAAALAMLRRELPDFSDAEFDALVAEDRIDWRWIEGEPYYQERFLETLRIYPDMNARGLRLDPVSDFRDQVLSRLQSQGTLQAEITLQASIAPAEPADPDAPAEAWLPIPAECPEQSHIQILDATPGGTLAPGDAPQRTIHWKAAAGTSFQVTYRYRIRATCHDLDALTGPVPEAEPWVGFLQEEAPHITFTPWLRDLCARVTAGCRDPLQRARAIYDYVTRHTRYRYQPAYACLDPIADRCAKNGWGDCGVMALLFITLCRIAGIPARWQSGLYVTPERAGCHDWAQFYLAPLGWLWADCSFGASAHRRGDEAARRHYFGNLDPLRMVANRAFYAQLTPPDPFWRDDPYDNQTGELVVNGRPLTGKTRVHDIRVLDFRLPGD